MTVHIRRGERFITAEDIVYQTGWHLMTVYRKAKNGEIPGAVKLGRALRFRQSEVEAWLKRTSRSADKNSDSHPKLAAYDIALTLQVLEREGLVTSYVDNNGERRYDLTDAGKQYLNVGPNRQGVVDA
jgi:excisionase family DNA binding protein